MPRKPTSPRQFLRLFTASSQPVVAFDTHQKLFFANEAASPWLGSDLAKSLGSRGPEVLFPPPEVLAGETKVVELPSPVAHSTERWQLLFIPLREPSGKIAGVLGIILPLGSIPFGGKHEREVDALRTRLHELRRDLSSQGQSLLLLGDSVAVRRLREQIQLAAQASGRVLIVGPNCEQVAHAINNAENSSPRMLVTLDGRIVDAEEMQRVTTNVLRQRQREPQTGATLFLIHAERLSTAAAQELSGILQLPQVELPIIATAARSLEGLARKNKFPAALATQLSALVIRVPKLRERASDIPLLTQALVERWNHEHPQHPRSGFSSAALDELCEYEWPRELNQLQEVVRHACENAKGLIIEVTDLPPVIQLAADDVAHPPRVVEPINLDQHLADIERQLIQQTLQWTKNNKTKAAEFLGLNRARFLRRLTQLGLASAEEVVFEPLPDEGPS